VELDLTPKDQEKRKDFAGIKTESESFAIFPFAEKEHQEGRLMDLGEEFHYPFPFQIQLFTN
jgi:hypothetical protein